MKYVNGGVLCVTLILILSAVAEAKDENLYHSDTYVVNEGGYCADIYRKDGGNFSNNRKHIYIKDDSGDIVPKDHPVYLDIDFYIPDARDSRVATVPCHGDLFIQGKKHLKLNANLAAITSTVKY
ncbi:hypothetical protein F6X50_01985 [Dickeya dianthicola]|uniref:hypothetical protein n=1 Tax=Dickeya dianthicola TaxID=204039 RepID=UPI0013693ABB|nr:hypothetical protein [Dickeya dianthicola]MCI4186510.1 hypothetical protein [Dickeya dianthicola]MCI4235623.1 hypothetical protein [Dickeya dianthicola]MCI4255791.1 hypothetical protein [Dickeya dianthicola]MZG23231.1 hypothetical protein [Dickeya dianthicola]MZI87911.1 hypothetical protein [Dickeya dianthicola]